MKILDDNDLEPMFDPTEYFIDLYKYTLEPGGTITPTQLPEFAQIGRVYASDPDLGQNALTRYFLASQSPLFNIDWLTGNVYLKRSLQAIFDYHFSNQKSDEQQQYITTLEVKTIDNGLKYSTFNALMRMSNSNLSVTEDALVAAASALHFNATTLKQLPKLSLFESAQVKIRLNSNLAEMYSQIFENAYILPLEKPILAQKRVPYKLLKIELKKGRSVLIAAKTQLKINIPLHLTQISSQLFLISFDLNLNVSTQRVKVEYCFRPNEICHNLIEFDFDTTLAMIDTLEQTCSVMLSVDNSTEKVALQMNRFNSVQNVVRIRASEIVPHYCRQSLEIFYSSNDSNIAIDDKTGLLTFNGLVAQSSGSYLIHPVFYYQNRRLNVVQSKPYLVEVDYSKRYYFIFSFTK